MSPFPSVCSCFPKEQSYCSIWFNTPWKLGPWCSVRVHWTWVHPFPFCPSNAQPSSLSVSRCLPVCCSSYCPSAVIEERRTSTVWLWPLYPLAAGAQRPCSKPCCWECGEGHLWGHTEQTLMEVSQKCENLILVLHACRITLPPGVVILLSLALILLISKLIESGL